MKRVNTFVAMGSEVQESKEKKEEGREETAKGSRKKMLGRKRAGKEQQKESSKKQKVEEEKESEEVDEVELKKLLVIKKDEDIAIDAIPLATKLPVIVDYKLHKEGMLVHYQLIRADGSSKRYSSMIRMLQGIDREDLEALWRIVKAKYGDTRPENDFERVLYGDLKVMFEPDIKSDVWRMLQGYRVTIWKLIDSSRVHFVRFDNLYIFMLVERRYPLTPITITNMLNKKLQTDHQNEMCYQLLKLMMNIKFRGGLLGLKRLHGFLEVTAAQKPLDDALVAPADHLEFGKCNMRLKTGIKPKEATFQVVLDAFALTPFYQEFLITIEVPAIYMQEFWATVTICPKVPRQRFEEPPLEHDILSFLRDLGHSGDIHYIIDMSIEYLHQPWRAIATIINKCLSGKDTAYEKICLSRAQIIWGMYNNKNIDYVYLLWEDFLFQVENKDTKKTNKMLYPRFTKVIIDYFMLKDQHEKTQVYGAILPQHLTNQAMLESIAYQTYYAYASGEKSPKEKYVRKKAESNTSPKKKTAPTSKGSRLKSSTKVAKTDKKKQPTTMLKTKGLAVLSEVALTEAEQLKLATKRSKT
ncbi:hypothetical protein Tco_0286855 [Tanacetum coccineum]